MRKIFKLFVNENIKTWKKLSTKILIILSIVALLGTLGLVKMIEYLNEKSDVTYSTFDWKESTQSEIKSIETSLANEELDQETRRNMQIQLNKNQLALKYDVNLYTTYWKSDILNKIAEAEEENKEIDSAKLIKVLEENNFKEYIEMQKQDLKKSFDNKEMTEQEYNDKILILNLKSKCEIGKNEKEEYWKGTLINETQSYQNSVRTGMDYANRKVLTVEKKQEYEEKIKINIYRLENNITPIQYVVNNYRMIFETMALMFVPAVIAIAAIIIAGGAISTEVSTGTIKFWALTPNKRWKILTSKILSMLFYIVIITLITSILTVIFGSVFFDTTGNEYLYVKDGNVQKIGNTLFIIGYYFAKTIPIIIFALFALMLSAVTRNTSVAVSISVAIYMGNSIAMAIINSYIKKDWIRFVPFNNLNIADKIFANFQNPMALMTGSYATSTSLQFSIGVLAVCAILMLVTMYDSFNKRDII